jgi:adenine-specific DNA-methyltransferase
MARRISDSCTRRPRAIKRLGRGVIAFLAQIEDFQKKLFLKKKFIVRSDYCLTLDNVPEDFYPEIAANDAQYEEWEKLFTISEIPASLENGGKQRSVEWLKANPYLVLDTAFFGQEFRDKLLASIEDLDEKTDGLLIESENFQALNLLWARYRERVKCIYIDPPYNTGNDEFLYKDNYQYSSWLSMMRDRLSLGHEVLAKDGAYFMSIDDIESAALEELADSIFGATNRVARFVWRSRQTPDTRNVSGVSVDHEYVFAYSKGDLRLKGAPVDESKYSNPDNDPRGPWMSDNLTGLATREQRPNLHYDIVNPDTGAVYPPPPNRGWAYSRVRMQQMIENGEILWPSLLMDAQGRSGFYTFKGRKLLVSLAF